MIVTYSYFYNLPHVFTYNYIALMASLDYISMHPIYFPMYPFTILS